MFNNNLQVTPYTYPKIAKPATTTTKQVKFNGASFEPIRPEHFIIRVDDTVVVAKKSDTKGFFGRMYDKLIKILADNSKEIIELEENSILPFEYKISYYA
ncbi:MAG: hypothetical protein AB1782_00700 [Cyanobacteriota bacterium]